MPNILAELCEHGQSLWYDNIARDLLESGAIQDLIDEGILGMTSNPSIFMKAITGSTTYDEQLRRLALQGKSAQDIFEAMAVDDIRGAADLLRPVYERTSGEDGYVSLEVSPVLAYDTQGTIADAARLHGWVSRPNLMIKIPATAEGLPAVSESIAAGINVNVTLIFSRKMYTRVMDAYMTGLERRIHAGAQIDGIASVASFFVSRADTLVDKLLNERIAGGGDEAKLRELMGKTAVANTKLAYQLFKETFASERFKALADMGARLQRPLWASTSTKNPAYSDVLYVEELIGANTINTAPPHTIEAFKDHGKVANTLEQGIGEAQGIMDELATVGIDMEAVTDQLLDEGVKAFADAFQQLLDAIEEKRQQFAGTPAG